MEYLHAALLCSSLSTSVVSSTQAFIYLHAYQNDFRVEGLLEFLAFDFFFQEIIRVKIFLFRNLESKEEIGDIIIQGWMVNVLSFILVFTFPAYLEQEVKLVGAEAAIAKERRMSGKFSRATRLF